MEPARLMVFIDGSNLLVELSRTLGISYRADKLPEPALLLARRLINDVFRYAGHNVIRQFWFGTFVGDETQHMEARQLLRKQGFEPVLFRGTKGREKGVDLAVAREMLVNAFNRNFDIGLLVAGDADYVGLVNEAKRYGGMIRGAFFKENLSPELRLALDQFYPLELDLSETKVKDLIQRLKDMAK